jgi:hypothetical protein
MGGMDTYSDRYLKMKVFQIKDNNLDFDAHDNRPVVNKPVVQPSSKTVPKKWTHPAPKWEPKHRKVGRDDTENDTIIDLEDQ